MNTRNAALAIRMISQGFLELALAIESDASSVRAQGAPGAGRAMADRSAAGVSPGSHVARPDDQEWPPFEDALRDASDYSEQQAAETPVVAKPAAKLEDQVPEGSLTQCPKHKVNYRDGKFGKYCPALSEDNEEGWTNAKGYCRVTPKSAVAWLRQHAEVPA